MILCDVVVRIHLKFPALDVEIVFMLYDVSRHDVKTSELNVGAISQKMLHPVHVTAGGIK